MGYIVSYLNPDTDGICSAFGLAHIRTNLGLSAFVPAYFGQLNAETLFVLQHFKIDHPTKISRTLPNVPLILLDTHHWRQLPKHFQFENVIEIVDHHPAGDPHLFPNAQIHNEPVGAVATLVSERAKSLSIELTRSIAGLLASAIISNTLHFQAPSTTIRDIDIFSWLDSMCNLDDNYVRKMFTTRTISLETTTSAILESDYKEFESKGQLFGISQIELPSTHPFLSREDIFDEQKRMRFKHGLRFYLVNCIDLLGGVSYLLAADNETRILIEGCMNAIFKGGVAKFEGILLRKSDLVPAILTVL